MVFDITHLYRFGLTLTAYCLLSGIAKLLTVTSFSRSMVTWQWVSGVDIRFICAIAQAFFLLFLTFITFYNIWVSFLWSLSRNILKNVKLAWCSPMFVTYWTKKQTTFQRHFRKGFSEIPNDDDPKQPLRSLSKALYLWCWQLLVKARGKTLQLSDCLLLPASDNPDFKVCQSFQQL